MNPISESSSSSLPASSAMHVTTCEVFNIKSEQNESPESETSIIGGVLRNVFRSFSKLFRFERISLGSLPRRIPTKVISKQADTLGQLYDISSEIYNAHGEFNQSFKSYTSKAHGISHQEVLFTRVKTWFHLGVKAMPGIIKSAVMGGILFSSFEAMESHLTTKVDDKKVKSDMNNILVPTAVAMIAGAASGIIHGASSLLWDKSLGSNAFFSRLTNTSSLLQKPYNFSSLLFGSIISHTFIHATLFGSYEGTKRCLLVMMGLSTENDDVTTLQGSMCVILGGLVSGILSEVVAEVLLPLEDRGLQMCLKSSRYIDNFGLSWIKIKDRFFNRLYVRSITPSVFSTMLGFIAYEYAKEMHSKIEDYRENN